MNGKETMPTYEEFKAEAVKRLEPMIEGTRKHYENSLTAEEYINSEEGTPVVESAYKRAAVKFSRGEINRFIFLGDSVSSVAYCLYMMYEPYLEDIKPFKACDLNEFKARTAVSASYEDARKARDDSNKYCR